MTHNTLCRYQRNHPSLVTYASNSWNSIHARLENSLLYDLQHQSFVSAPPNPKPPKPLEIQTLPTPNTHSQESQKPSRKKKGTNYLLNKKDGGCKKHNQAPVRLLQPRVLRQRFDQQHRHQRLPTSCLQIQNDVLSQSCMESFLLIPTQHRQNCCRHLRTQHCSSNSSTSEIVGFDIANRGTRIFNHDRFPNSQAAGEIDTC